jgi:uncharacterized protein (TIGR00369 family)
VTDVPDDEARQRQARRRRMLRVFAESVPHNQALGIQIVELGDGFSRYRLPYDARLAGNPDNGVLHGGVITALLDACCGSAAFSALPEPQPIATLDLRIDYLSPAAPGRDVVAHATCTKVTRNVAFVRATAYQDDEASPIATAAGTFMIATRAIRRSPP